MTTSIYKLVIFNKNKYIIFSIIIKSLANFSNTIVNQNKYLSSEKEVMKKIFAQVKNENLNNTVIDTTGSVIQTGKNFSEKLKQYSMVIYIEASENMKEKMFKQYLEEPKPVVFGDVYSQG